MNELNPNNVYQAKLFDYIQQYHPYLLENKEELDVMLIERAKAAEKAYIDAIKENKNPSQAEEEANSILFVGIHFSPVTWIQEVYLDNKGVEIDMDRACKIYKETRHLFDKYEVNDLFPGSDQEEELSNELLDWIQRNE